MVSLHSTTLQSTLSWGSIQQLSRSLLSVSLTGLYCAMSWKLINSVCLTSQPFVSGISLCAVCAANIFRAPYQDRSSVYTKCLRAMTVINWVRTLLFQFLVSSAHPSIHSRWSGHRSLNALKIIYYVRRNKVFSHFLPLPLSSISPSWQWRLMQRHLPPGRTLSLHYSSKALFSCHGFTSLWVELHVCIPECVCVSA